MAVAVSDSNPTRSSLVSRRRARSGPAFCLYQKTSCIQPIACYYLTNWLIKYDCRDQTRKTPSGYAWTARSQPQSHIAGSALEEFALAGLSGARMDTIAESAGVNKALLYYYFRDKDDLYAAVLDEFFARFLDRLTETLSHPASAGERFLSYVRTHFDTVAESPHYARIFVGEIMRAGRGGSPHIERVFARYMQPIASRVVGVLEEGISSGRIPSGRAYAVHAFGSGDHCPLLCRRAHARQVSAPVDPFSPKLFSSVEQPCSTSPRPHSSPIAMPG